MQRTRHDGGRSLQLAAFTQSCKGAQKVVENASMAWWKKHMCAASPAGAVLADVGLVWQNCRTFNAEGSAISAMADEAEAHFVQLWAKKELPFESADLSGQAPEPRKHASLRELTGDVQDQDIYEHVKDTFRGVSAVCLSIRAHAL